MTRRLSLFNAGADLFVRYGFRKTSIDELTRAAGISKGAFYLEFANKEALYVALVRHKLIGYLRQVAQRVAADPDGGRLSKMYAHSFEALDDTFLTALYTGKGPAVTPMVGAAEQHRPRLELGADFLGRLQRAGLIRPELDAAVLSHTLSVLTLGPLLAEPLLHSPQSPPLSQTLGLVSSMIVAAIELPGGDLVAGKLAFAEWAESMTALLGDPVGD